MSVRKYPKTLLLVCLIILIVCLAILPKVLKCSLATVPEPVRLSIATIVQTTEGDTKTTSKKEYSVKEHTEILAATPNVEVQEIISVTRKADIEIIVLEPWILGNMKTPPNGRKDVTALAVFQNHVETLTSVGFKQIAKQHGFSITCFVGEDVRQLDTTSANATNDSIPLGCLIATKNHIFELVILYKRKDSYLWHGGIKNKDMIAHNEQFMFLSHARAFEIFATKEVILADHETRIQIPVKPDLFLWQLPASKFLECNYTSARDFREKYADLSKSNLEREARMVKAMVHVKKNMINLKKRLWIFSGTILGWHRQCGVMYYTSDIDFGAWIGEHDDSIRKAFKKNKIVTLRRIFGKLSDSYEFQMWGYGIHIDIFFTYHNKNRTWIGGVRVPNHSKVKFTYPQFSLCSCELLGHRFNVPCEAQSVVEAEYGKNWMVPAKKWIWSVDPPNKAENGKWTDTEWEKEVHFNYDAD